MHYYYIYNHHHAVFWLKLRTIEQYCSQCGAGDSPKGTILRQDRTALSGSLKTLTAHKYKDAKVKDQSIPYLVGRRSGDRQNGKQ